ncbi:MAG TPA: L-histidine N(alpha)-methyltransferase [Bryobacteraceae bacterium]|jgi:dimethylhistidine N-methyltransferase|nr:L-histidine N(alpha)-methyltransferase [Bryobacteraceae bacterium]
MSINTLAPQSGIFSSLADDVRRGLTQPGQKSLPSVYLYDELGSALFEAITKLPEYGLTRADERLLTTYARSIARSLAKHPVYVVELGSGSARKTRPLLQALNPSIYYPIDVSATSLERAKLELNTVCGVVPVEARYLDGLLQVLLRRNRGESVLLLFLGSTIGNFEGEEAVRFLRTLREMLVSGDALLLGADLVKPERMFLDAYDDPTGVSAAFTLNLLGRINRELGADFELRSFRHEAEYNISEQRVEIFATSTKKQTVRIKALDLTVHFEQNERILTEYSHKYTIGDLRALASQSGFAHKDAWIDHEWPFAECLWTVDDPSGSRER